MFPAAAAALAFVAFLPALGASFVAWDDEQNFLDNPFYRGLGWDNLRWMWTTFHMGHYIPVSWMTLGLDYVVWGMNPFGYHLINLLLHAANAALMYFIALRLIRSASSEADSPALGRRRAGGASADGAMMQRLAALFAALVFAVHPLRVESVAWITERRDMLSGVFCLASILLYLRSVEHRDDAPSESNGWMQRICWSGLALFVLALLSKATAVIVPAVLLIVNVYPLRRLGAADPGSRWPQRLSAWWSRSARNVYLEIAPFALLSAATSGLSIVALKPPAQLTFWSKIAVSSYSLFFYMAKTLWPSRLAPLYEMPREIDPTAAQYVVAYAIVVGLSILFWSMRRRWPAATTGWVAFLVISLPLLGIVQNGPQIAADRYTYQSSQALGLLAAGALMLLKNRRRAATALVAGYALAYTPLTWIQTGVWHDSVTLWSRVLTVDSTSSIALTAVGNMSAKQGRTDEAIDAYRRSLRINPVSAEATNNLGIALARRGDTRGAIAYYQRAILLRPDHYEAYNNWGAALATLNDLAGAVDMYRRALAIKPDYADAEVNWGNALVRLDRPAEAIPHYEAAVRARPNSADAHNNWGVALARQGRYPEAVAHFQAALAIAPGDPEALRYLELALRLQR